MLSHPLANPLGARGLIVAFGGINYLAVLGAAVASWLLGAAWYALLARPWMIALGKTRTELMGPDGRPSPLPFVVAFLAQFLMAWVLAGLIGHTGPGQAGVAGGIVAGFLVWLGFVITTLSTNHGFGGHRSMLTVIDGGHWLAVLLLQGAVLGLFAR
jgi:Protein of unknown function (DUF1761)